MASAPTFSIGQLAARCGRSVDTLRWYDAQGLIPGVQRDSGGRRRFVAEHVDWLALMDRLRLTGMSIAAMRRYTALVRQGKPSLAERRQMLAEHREQVHRTLAEWQEALSLLDDKIDFYGQWLHSGRRPPWNPPPLPARTRKPR